MADQICDTYPCYAPVFPAVRHPVARAAVQSLDVLLIASLIVLTLGFINLTERGRCRIRQILFRIENAQFGNPVAGVLLSV